MKKRSLGSIFLAFISALIFIIIINVSFTCYQLINIFLFEDKLHTLSKETFLNHEVLGDIFASALNESFQYRYEQANEVYVTLPDPLEGEDLEALFALAIPEELISDIAYNVISSIFQWLSSEKSYPEIQIYMEPLTENAVSHLSGIVDACFAILPDCTPEELSYYLKLFAAEALLSADTSVYPYIPKCKLQEPLLGSIKIVVTATMIDELNQAPEMLDMTSIINPENSTSEACMKCHTHGRFKKDPHLPILSEIKKYYNYLLSRLNYVWFAPVIFLLCILAFGAKSIKSSFRWVGGSFFISGIVSFLVIFHLSGNSILITPDLFCDIPGSFCPSFIAVKSFMKALYNIIGLPMYSFSAGQLLGGAGLIFASWKFK